MAKEKSGRLVYAAMHSGPLSTPQGRDRGISAGLTCCICFADTRLAVQQEYLTLSFPNYEVGCPGSLGLLTARIGFILVVLRQCFDQSPSLVSHD